MPTSRSYLPDEWAHLAKCPICLSTPLKVERCPGDPDRMQCTRCGTAFEVEQGGPHFHLVKIPAMIPQDMLGEWLMQAEIQRRVRQVAFAAREGMHKPVAAGVSIPSAPFVLQPEVGSLASAQVSHSLAQGIPLPAPLTGSMPFSHAASDKISQPGTRVKGVLPVNVIEHANQLYQLGNSPAKVREILTRTEDLSPEQMALIMAPIEAAESKRRSRTRNGVLVALGILLLVTACIGLTVTLLRGSNVASPGKTGPLDRSNMPAALQTLIPPGAKIMNPPTPAVQRLPTQWYPVHVQCPTNGLDAADLFGGKGESWTFQNNGWILITTDPVEISVPPGFNAGYLVLGQNMEMRSITGPARISNIHTVSIQCQ